MKHRAVVLLGCLAASLAVTVGTSAPASAAKRAYEDKKLGFRMKIEDSWVQVPPKLGKADAYLVGDWYEDSAKFDGSLRPMFQVLWWAQSKAPVGMPPPPVAAVPPTLGGTPETPPAQPAPDAPAPSATDPAAPKPETPPEGTPPATTDPPAPAPEPTAGDPAPPADPVAGDPKPPDPAAPVDPKPPDEPKKPDPAPPAPDPKPPDPKPPDPKPPDPKKPDPKKAPAPDPDAEPPPPPPIENINDYAGRYLAQERFFGPVVPMPDRWKDADSYGIGARKKTVIEYFEVNAPAKHKPKGKDKDVRKPAAYCLVGQLVLDRPNEIVNVGFFGACATENAKKMRAELVAMMKSFEDLKSGTDSANAAALQDLSQDPVIRRQQIRKSKVIKGWDAIDTDHYILLFSKEVDPNLVRSIGNRIESIRAQVYEVLFPPDKPVTAVSIVRVCKDPEQYSAYGGPGGSAGYWDDQSEELVFYESDQKEDSLRVLYHEAFHQFIYYSVGDVAPHSWFNEGHGDYFAGHDYKGGKFVRGVFLWRTSTAKAWKRNPVRPPLREWITWTQAQYYGQNKAQVPPGANYALGWSFVYFLRTTKKPEYQGILDRYFKSLKGAVTRAREIDAAWDKKVKDAKAAGQPEPEKETTSERGTKGTWMKQAVDDAFTGVDWEKLEKDWLAADW